MTTIHLVSIALLLCLPVRGQEIKGPASGHWQTILYYGNTAMRIDGTGLTYHLTFPAHLRPLDQAVVWSDDRYDYVLFFFKDIQEGDVKAWVANFSKQCPIARKSVSSIKAPTIAYNRFVPTRHVWHATGVVRTDRGPIGFDWLDTYMPKDIAKSRGYDAEDYALNDLMHGVHSPIRDQKRVIWLRCAFPRRSH